MNDPIESFDENFLVDEIEFKGAPDDKICRGDILGYACDDNPVEACYLVLTVYTDNIFELAERDGFRDKYSLEDFDFQCLRLMKRNGVVLIKPHEDEDV